jgi:hypothetical protein
MIAWLVATAIPKDSRGVRAAVGTVARAEARENQGRD